MAELFMEYFPTFSKHLSNIVWSSNLVNLVALQPADFESTNPAKWKFFESSRVGELLLAKYQCKWLNFGKDVECRQRYRMIPTHKLSQQF